MSTRSPKDAVVKTEQFKNTLKNNLKSQLNESAAVIKTLNQSLNVKTGEEAVELLVNR
jgi:hypothetical protein